MSGVIAEFLPPVSRTAGGAARQRQILDTTLELVALEGFGGLSLRRIAAQAGLSTPGLLRHFRDRDQILAALLQRATVRNTAWIARNRLDLADPAHLVRLGFRNDEERVYRALYSTTIAAASHPDHPAHQLFQQQNQAVRTALRSAIERLEPGLDQAGINSAVVRLIAAWDGLQLQTLYDSRTSIGKALHYRFGLSTADDRAPDLELERAQSRVDYLAEVRREEAGYSTGRRRRGEVLKAATTAFSRSGYHPVTLQDISNAAGIPKSSLLHHFPSKDALLQGVLNHRDLLTATSDEPLGTATDLLLGLIRFTGDGRDFPAVIAAYSVLLGEGVAPEHPAHAFFAARLHRVRGYVKHLFLRLQAEDGLSTDRDPDLEAAWFVALWDVLQLQWLYRPGEVDIGAELRSHLATMTHLRLPQPGSTSDQA